jgi:hypothetical protein
VLFPGINFSKGDENSEQEVEYQGDPEYGAGMHWYCKIYTLNQ